jgi:hypothetical protein
MVFFGNKLGLFDMLVVVVVQPAEEFGPMWHPNLPQSCKPDFHETHNEAQSEQMLDKCLPFFFLFFSRRVT